MFSGNGGQIGGDRPQSLDAWLLVHADRIDGPCSGRARVARDLPVDQENLPHLAVELGIFALEVIRDLVGMKRLFRKNPVDRRLGRLGQGRMAGGFGMGPDIGRQGASGPDLGGQTQVLGSGAGQGDDPRLGLGRDDRRLRPMVKVLETRFHPHRQRFVDAFVDGQRAGSHLTGNRQNGRSLRVTEKNSLPLSLPLGSCSGLRKSLKCLFLFVRQIQGSPLGCSRHRILLGGVLDAMARLRHKRKIYLCFNETNY
jgi:hypothetical protein